VCLAVWLSHSGRSVADKVLAVVPPVAAFVAAGFEHSVANMYFLPMGVLVRNHASDAFRADTDAAPADFPDVTLANGCWTTSCPSRSGT
jgi:formate transporter